MAKANEIAYVEEVARLNGVPLADFERYLLNKPFSDPRCHEYLMDVAQIMSFLPPAPAKVLDVGVGSGWTSELFAKAGYEVTGIDISPDMIALARRRNSNARFFVSDYEVGQIAGRFEAAVIYDALHHAENEDLVIKNIFNALVPGGVLITIEPGRGHSTSGSSISAVQQYGTTEKDMPYKLQSRHMANAGFSTVRQYHRAISTPNSLLQFIYQQLRLSLGSSSVVVARKA
jgi:2-polyprenyl-3-methyl-5-hydroxy-6-metoxy-1,4-benzoquinol methylase